MSRDTTPSDPTRRTVLRATTGLAAATLATGVASTAAAQESSVRPDFGGWLEGVDGGFRDARGEDEVTVLVGTQGNTGSFAFSPAGLWIDPGTTVRWQWTGKGGGHNVHTREGADFESDIIDGSGVHFEHTFETGGITTYQCDPHAALGMKGAIAVGDDVPTVTAGAGAPWTPPGGALGVAFIVLTIGTAGTASAAVLAGEFAGSLRRQTDGPTGAYAAGAGVAVLALVLLLAVVAKLVIG